MKQRAIDLAFEKFNTVEELHDATNEWGMVLYEREGNLLSGPVRWGERNRVQVYEAHDLLWIAGVEETYDGSYRGDHHAHTVGTVWTSQLPSPDDLSDVSVLYDLWSRGAGQAPLPVAPRLQVVQSLLWGDVFVLEPTPERRRFETLEEQANGVATTALAYRVAFLQAENDHGDLGLDATPDEIDAFVAAVLEPLNRALQDRATITFHKNEAGRRAWEEAGAEEDDAAGG